MKLELIRPKIQEITLEFLKDKPDHYTILSDELRKLINDKLPSAKHITSSQLASCFTKKFTMKYIIFRRLIRRNKDLIYLFKKVIE